MMRGARTAHSLRSVVSFPPWSVVEGLFTPRLSGLVRRGDAVGHSAVF